MSDELERLRQENEVLKARVKTLEFLLGEGKGPYGGVRDWINPDDLGEELFRYRVLGRLFSLRWRAKVCRLAIYASEGENELPAKEWGRRILYLYWKEHGTFQAIVSTPLIALVLYRLEQWMKNRDNRTLMHWLRYPYGPDTKWPGLDDLRK